MEVEYFAGGVLIFSILILYINLITLGVCVEPRQLDTSEFIGCRFDGPPIAARLYLTNSAKRKRRKPPQLMERQGASRVILPPWLRHSN